MITQIATVFSGDSELDCETEVSIVQEPDTWRLVISDMVKFHGGYRDPLYQRYEILLVEDYFEHFTAGDFCFILSGFGVAEKFEHEFFQEKLPMLKPGEQIEPEINHDVFCDRNRDQWPRFGIVDVITRRGEIAESMHRVEHMEKILDKLKSLMLALENETADPSRVKEFKRFQSEVKKLDKYYTSNDWKKDFETDERGEFPSYLKRGVLSEDAVYDALSENEELLESIENGE